jgi:antirestriction protein ArdC
MSEKLDVYSRVTNKIIADLERGNLTWLQPWQAGHNAGPVAARSIKVASIRRFAPCSPLKNCPRIFQ